MVIHGGGALSPERREPPEKGWLCRWGFHDWEIVGDKYEWEIRSELIYELKLGLFHTKFNDAPRFRNKICMRCHERSDKLDQRKHQMKYELTGNREDPRKEEAKRLWES